VPGAIAGSSPGDRVYRVITTAFAWAVPLLLALITLEVVLAAWPAFRTFGFDFLTSSEWDEVRGNFGAAPMIYGTVVSSVLALILATPLALGVAIFLSEFAPSWLRQPVAFLVDLLAAIPSVVYGLWGIFVLLPVLREKVMPFLATTRASATRRSSADRPTDRRCSPRPSSWRSWSSRTSPRSRARCSWPCRARSAKRRWRSAPPSGR